MASLLLSLFFTIAFSSYASAKPKWKDCGSVNGVVTDVNVAGCESAPFQCELVRGQNSSFAIDFDSKSDTSALKAVVHGIIADIPVPFPLDNPDACKDSNIVCPLKSGTHYKYSSSIFVKPSYPALSLTVKWELQDKDGKDVACVYIPVKIK